MGNRGMFQTAGVQFARSLKVNCMGFAGLQHAKRDP